MKLQEVFIANIKSLRTQKGLSQARLAEKSDLSDGMIGQIESGASAPSFSSIEKLAKALEVESYKLFMRPEDHLSFRDSEVNDIIDELSYTINKRIQKKD